jgi:selenide, water dikinase
MANSTSQQRLTQFSHGAGCGCKIGPGALADVLGRLGQASHPDLILGAGDDAAVWRIDDERALVATIDVITPIVDDARTWGRIAATNAVSDVYAMGAQPLFGLNFVGWHTAALSDDLLVEVLAGANQVAAEGGWMIVGGHSVDDPEPKFGVAVIGEAHPDAILAKGDLRPGDALVLSKPLGVGLAVTALKAGAVAGDVIEPAIASMLRTNAEASRVAVAAQARAATDVTGFGLLGHLRSLLAQAPVDAEVDVAAVPLLPGAKDLVSEGHVPGGTRRNLQWISQRLDAGVYAEDVLFLLADPQTSGGLLFAVDPRAADEAVSELRGTGHDAAVVGSVVPGTGRMRLV